MIDTPRTDDRIVFIDGNPWVNAPFAQSLEHELNIELERANYYRDKWQRNEQRIQRLEKAGDEMANAYEEICYDSYDKKKIANWRKAKESKL